jgi:lichenan operon transcriptional antiterminator
MITELGKKILSSILMEEKPVPGQKICSFCDTSINTIRKEIPSLNATLTRHGCRIVTLSSAGYLLQIDDKKAADPYLSQLLYRIRRNDYMNLEKNAKAYRIMRSLLTRKKPCTVNHIAEEMYCSRSTISRELPKIRAYLSKFNLTLAFSHTDGIAVKGDEWNKRLCMLYLEKTYNALPDAEKKSEARFSETFFRFDPQDLQAAVRSTLLTICPAHQLPLPQLYLPKVMNYILVAKSRTAERKEMKFSQAQIEEACGHAAYDCAKDIYAHLPFFLRQDAGETEYQTLSMLLQTLADYSSIDLIPVPKRKELQKEVRDLLAFINKRYQISYLCDEQLKNDLAVYLYKLEKALLFHIPLDPEIMSPAFSTGIITSELCAEFAKFYNFRHGIKLPYAETFGTYYIFNRAMKEYLYFPYRQRILVCSVYGLVYAENVAARLKREYAPFIASVDCVTYVNPEEIDPEKYDMLVSDFSYDLFNFTMVPIVTIESIRSPHNNEVLNQYFRNLLRTRFLQIFTPDKFSHVQVHNRQELYSTIAESLKDDVVNKEDFIKDLAVKDYFIGSERQNHIVLISPFSYTFPQPDFRLFISGEGFVWNRNRSYVFIYYQYGDGSPESVRLIDELIKCFIHRSYDQIEELKDMDYLEICNTCLQIARLEETPA